MGLLKLILFPFSIIYGLAVKVRNHLYNIGYTKSFRFEVPVIVVGNLSAGGTGKTPMVEYLIRLLTGNYSPAILSRGYKRSTKGFYLADDSSSSNLIGDEPMQYHNKFDIPVAVCEDRVEGIPKILFERPETDLIIMDDGYQHRAVNPYISLLLTDALNIFTDDYLLPSGRLREHRREAKRADVIIITKLTTGTSNVEIDKIEKSIRKYNSDSPIFFTTLKYHPPIGFDGKEMPSSESVILLSGIAKSETLVNYIVDFWSMKEHLKYADHHEYTSKDIDKICKVQKQNNIPIITTEKDAARLKNPEWKQKLAGIPIYYLPISISFIKNGSEFDKWVTEKIQSFSGLKQ